MIAVVVVHPETLSRPDIPLSSLGGNGELLDVKAQDVQATKCAEMPCILAKQGDGNSNDKINTDLSFSWSIISQPINTGNVHLISLNFLAKADISVLHTVPSYDAGKKCVYMFLQKYSDYHSVFIM